MSRPTLPPARNSLLHQESSMPPRVHRGAGEFAGGTAAECTAVVCCVPLTVMNIVVLVVYKVPAGLCKKAIQKHKKIQPRRKPAKFNDVLLQERSSTVASTELLMTRPEKKVDAGAADDDGGDFSESEEMEKEMWRPFNGAGFWRSHSQTSEHLN